MGWEVGEKFKREGIYVYLWLIHVDVWQKPTQHCKAIILQLKIKNKQKSLWSYLILCIFAHKVFQSNCGNIIDIYNCVL